MDVGVQRWLRLLMIKYELRLQAQSYIFFVGTEILRQPHVEILTSVSHVKWIESCAVSTHTSTNLKSIKKTSTLI